MSTRDFQPSFNPVDSRRDLVDARLLPDGFFAVVGAIAAVGGGVGFVAGEPCADLSSDCRRCQSCPSLRLPSLSPSSQIFKP
jgi:hypothetical protein